MVPSAAVLPKIADAYRFIAAGESRSGQVSVTQLLRLLDRLPEEMDMAAAEPLSWQVRGVPDAMGRPALEITVEGMFPLVCQRCLQPLLWPVAQRTKVLVAQTPEALAALDEEVEQEVVLCDPALDVLALIEDELLLSLPFAPRHEACPVGV